MHVIRKVVLFVLALVVLFPDTSEALVSPYVELLYLHGTIGYAIRGEVSLGGEPAKPYESRLEYDFPDFAIEAGAFVDLSDKVQLKFSGWGAPESDNGHMVDDDWLKDNTIWISSVSDQRASAWGLGGEFRYWVIRKDNFSLAPICQVLYEYFFATAMDTDQKSNDPAYVVFDPGVNATYQQESVSLTGGAVLHWNPVSWFQLEGLLSISPFTFLWDADNHLERYKYSDGLDIAFAFQVDISPEFVLFEKLRVGPFVSYYWMGDYGGYQDQSFYGIYENTPSGRADDDMIGQCWQFGGQVSVDLDLF